MNLSGTARLVFIVAAAIVVAFLAFSVIGIISTLVGWVIKIAVFVVIVYAVYLLARSTMGREKPKSKGA